VELDLTIGSGDENSDTDNTEAEEVVLEANTHADHTIEAENAVLVEALNVLLEESVENVIPEGEAENVLPEKALQNVIPEEEAENVLPEKAAQNVLPEEEAKNVLPEEAEVNDIVIQANTHKKQKMSF
jgi:hypothetical protein